MRLLLAPLLLAAAMALVPPAASAQPTRGAAMVRIPAGTYVPLYAASGSRQAVAAFSLDRHPVTRAEYEAFLRRQPRWRGDGGAGAAPTRHTGGPVAGDSHDMGGDDGRRPATGMTWHAASAYCAERGARLPTLAEWEYVAAASDVRRDAARDPAFMQQLLATYSTRPRPLPPVDRAARNVYGVRGMHDLAWEWVDDVGRVDHAHHGSHAAHGAWCASAAIGAADPGNYPAFLRFAVRSRLTADSAQMMLGFRCAA
jgi:formylglycine-generating enzyme required for sulfatase activity